MAGGYILARSCRRCGGDIRVRGHEEKEEKDARGVDVHTYEKVCERVRAAATATAPAKKETGST